MCFLCEKNEYYREGRGSHDEYISRKAIEGFVSNITKQLEELKTKRFVSGISSNPYEFGACHAIDIAIETIKKAV
jgi:hypothetical protein